MFLKEGTTSCVIPFSVVTLSCVLNSQDSDFEEIVSFVRCLNQPVFIQTQLIIWTAP